MASYLWRLCAALMLTLAVSACQSTNIPPEKLATIRTVSVINIARNDWEWRRQGFLNWERQRHPGEDLRLGDRAGEVTTALLAKQYTLIPTGKIDPDTLRIPLSQVGGKIGEHISKLPVRPDAVLLIRQGGVVSGSTVLNAPSTMIGFGVYDTTHLFEEYVSAYGIIEFELFDGKTFDSLARFNTVLPSSASPEGSTPFTWLKYPGKIDRIGTWTDRFDDQPPANRTLVRAVLTGFIDQSIPFTLRKKGLIR